MHIQDLNLTHIIIISLQYYVCSPILVKPIPVWLRKRLISAGLETVLWHIEKSCIASYYRQFSTNID